MGPSGPAAEPWRQTEGVSPIADRGNSCSSTPRGHRGEDLSRRRAAAQRGRLRAERIEDGTNGNTRPRNEATELLDTGTHMKNALIYHTLSGHAFFSGIAFIQLAWLIAIYRNGRWAAVVRTVSACAGADFDRGIRYSAGSLVLLVRRSDHGCVARARGFKHDRLVARFAGSDGPCQQSGAWGWRSNSRFTSCPPCRRWASRLCT